MSSGSYYNYFRTYDPSIGRYTQSDPIGLAGGLKTYGYAMQNSLKYSDPRGLDVLLQTHRVALGNNHSKVTIIPQSGSRFAGDPRFANTTQDGRPFATLGAGPSGILAFGTLESGINRERDILLGNNNFSRSVFEHFCPSIEYEDDLIERLLRANSRFDDGRFDYELFPTRGEYNSNSYINGLLRSQGIELPAPPSTPGFGLPVPNDAFGPRQ